MVINHRRFGQGKIPPGETITGTFLVQGSAGIPFNFYRGERIPVTVCILDSSAKTHKSKGLAVLPIPNDRRIDPPPPPTPITPPYEPEEK